MVSDVKFRILKGGNGGIFLLCKRPIDLPGNARSCWTADIPTTRQQHYNRVLPAVNFAERSEPAEMDGALPIGAGAGFSKDRLVVAVAGTPCGAKLGRAEHTGGE